MKIALIAMTLLVAPVSAIAQDSGTAAATLPNTFDRPAPAPASRPAPAAAPAAVAAVSTPETVEAAKTALRAAILAMQAGTPDYEAMTPDLAAKIREQSARLIPMLQGYGEVQAGVHAGSENGAELFGVAFERATTQWMIALDPEGKIAVLLFRPAPVADEPAEDETAPPAN